MLSDESVDQLAIQAAVWNQEDDMTFEQMAAKIMRKPGRPIDRPFFTRQQLAWGQEVLECAYEQASREIEAEEQAKSEGLQTIDTPVKTDKTIENLTEQILSK